METNHSGIGEYPIAECGEPITLSFSQINNKYLIKFLSVSIEKRMSSFRENNLGGIPHELWEGGGQSPEL